MSAASVRPWLCTKCDAAPGQPCRSLTTGRVTDTHAARLRWDGVLENRPDPEETR
jgi:hypothetical protein